MGRHAQERPAAMVWLPVLAVLLLLPLGWGAVSLIPERGEAARSQSDPAHLNPPSTSQPSGSPSTPPTATAPSTPTTTPSRDVSVRPAASPTTSAQPTVPPTPAPTSVATPVAKPKPKPTLNRSASAPAPKQRSAADEVLGLVNAARREAGCGALTLDDRANRAAQLHAEDMAEHDYFSHTSQDGRTFDDRMRAQGYDSPGGENIAAGQRSAAEVMDDWMSSPGHRANIENCSFRALGVGLDVRGWYWVQNFGY